MNVTTLQARTAAVKSSDAVRAATALVPRWAWQAARDPREHADVVEITDLPDVRRWTNTGPNMRVIVRRELLHPGATLEFVISSASSAGADGRPTAAGLWVTPVEQVVRVRTGERGVDAV